MISTFNINQVSLLGYGDLCITKQITVEKCLKCTNCNQTSQQVEVNCVAESEILRSQAHSTEFSCQV